MALLIGGVVVLALVGAALAWPLLRRPVPFDTHRAGAGQMYDPRDGLLDAMSELETDFRTGKISPADYQARKADYEQRYLALVNTPVNTPKA